MLDLQHDQSTFDWRTEEKRLAESVKSIDAAAVRNLANATELPAFATLTNTMLCMACAGDKVETDDELPLYELYNGPTWSSVRRSLGPEGQYRARIIVLSGKYGICTANLHSKPYEARLSSQKADDLIRGGILGLQYYFGLLDHRKGFHAPAPICHMQAPYDSRSPRTRFPWKAVIICGGSDYRRAFMALIAQLLMSGDVAPDAAILATFGGIGEQRSQIGRWAAQLVENTSRQRQ